MNIELSVIIPVINEEHSLPALLAVLEDQQGCRFEAVFCDGGSRDATLEVLRNAAGRERFPLRVVAGGAGRGRQMNVGARAARGEFLLFLHADSRFRDARALARGVAGLRQFLVGRQDDRVAARFALRFDLPRPEQSFGYYYYEEKARLALAGCIHGDQGFLLPRRFFEEIGPFDESRPFLEDEALAAAVAQKGAWRLLPVEIFTSPRRFQTEGLAARQVLNALIMNALAIGWDDFLREAPRLYRQPGKAQHLDLLPFFLLIEQRLGAMGPPARRRLLERTGRYVRSQAWQPLFALVTRMRWRRRAPRRMEPWGEGFCARWERLTDRPALNRLTGALTRAWFRWTLARLRRKASDATAGQASKRDEQS